MTDLEISTLWKQAMAEAKFGQLTIYFARLVEARAKALVDTKKLVDNFLSWPLPASVCSDTCVIDPKHPYPRIGTNLLTATEAEQMFEYCLSEKCDQCEGEGGWVTAEWIDPVSGPEQELERCDVCGGTGRVKP